MKKRLFLLFITSLIFTCAAKADYLFSEPSDFTGEAFFTPPTQESSGNVSNSDSDSSASHTTPPVKQLRLWIRDKVKSRESKNNELAPIEKSSYVGEIETSEYVSKDLKDDFEEMAPDGFEADEESAIESKENKKPFFKKKNKVAQESNSDDIILDCDNIDYDTPNYLINAKGNVNVNFVKQGTRIKADTMIFDRINNTVKAEGNVRIFKGGQIITGDYIFVDMNEENALIENPMTRTQTIEIKAKKGYIYGDKVVQEDGTLTIDKSFPIDFKSAARGPQTRNMLVPKNENLSTDMENGIVKFTAKSIKVVQKGDLETIAIKRGRLFKGEKTIFKVPAIKIYTNKNRDYAETNYWEFGSYRGMGFYTGPGVVFELPKGSVLKTMPVFNYNSGAGFGAMGRFSSGTNQTFASYGTAAKKFILFGEQKLDDNLLFQYGMNSYLNEWFLGRRRPKYGAELIYQNSYSSKNFLLKDRTSYFKHRFDAGYYQDLDFDSKFEKLKGSSLGTTRFKYMAEGRQNLYEYKDKQNLKAFRVSAVSQFVGGLYGTGDTKIIGRLGPNVHMQYKRWMQDIGYFFSVYEDNTPMPVFDAYRYGKQNLYVREYVRLCRYLTLSWFGSMNLTNDSANGRTFQENSFYFSIGPDDMKLNLGYDFIRENLYCTIEILTDAKGTKVEYETFEIKQDKKPKKEEKKTANNDRYKAPVAPRVLQRAEVENVKVMEDVL